MDTNLKNQDDLSSEEIEEKVLKTIYTRKEKTIKETPEEKQKRIKNTIASMANILSRETSSGFDKILAQCAKTTLEHGFDVENIPVQLLLIVTEVGEALENFVPKSRTVNEFCRQVIDLTYDIEHVRKTEGFSAEFLTGKDSNLVEELCDIVIRVFSFIGGNDLINDFKLVLANKMNYNENRPYMHGKKA